MLPGDTRALSPSGLRLGVQEMTRVGMGVDQMEQIAELYARVLLKGEDPHSVRNDVRQLKSEHQIVGYCFNDDNDSAYPF